MGMTRESLLLADLMQAADEFAERLADPHHLDNLEKVQLAQVLEDCAWGWFQARSIDEQERA